MKKFISMVMAAAMVVSLVPATAFAANAATFKVVGDYELTEKAADDAEDLGKDYTIAGTEIQMKVTDVNSATATGDSWKITLDFENAEVDVDVNKGATIANFVSVKNNEGAAVTLSAKATYEIDKEDDTVAITLVEEDGMLQEDDIIVLNLDVLDLYMTKAADVTVSVSGKFGDSEEMTLVAVLEEGIEVVLKKVAEVAEEASKELKSDLIVKTNVGTFAPGQIMELKLNSGFEWDCRYDGLTGAYLLNSECEEDTLVYRIDRPVDEFVFDNDGLKIEAVDAKAGDMAKITVKVKEGTVKNSFKATATVDAMEVVGETVTLSVEEDEDVPVIYSGVKVNNFGINDDSDHLSLEVTIEESVAGSLDVKKDIVLSLTEGVFVTEVFEGTHKNVEYVGGAYNDFAAVMKDAYKEGEQKAFEIERKTFKATDDLTNPGAMELSFTLELIAVPGFEGDVELTLDGAGFEEAQTVTIAKFVAPYTVEAAQNDLIIDYRNTEVPTAIVVKEAEAGLWTKDMAFEFEVDYMDFEGDATYTVNEESEMEVDDVFDLGFKVDEESDEEAAVVTIDGIELYMNRSLAAGAYDLELGTSAAKAMMTTEALWTSECGALCDEPANSTNVCTDMDYFVADFADWDVTGTTFVPEKATVKEGFVNIVTAGRDQDDASFTKKVVVTIGASELVAGEDTVALDVPAYINAAGYTMLPVRAVAVALGIHNNNVIWDQATKTVTILYGQRIITMSVGSKVINVNGSAIPASAAVEIVDGRTFLGLRDLATALGVVDITWDAATQTATLNGNR